MKEFFKLKPTIYLLINSISWVLLFIFVPLALHFTINAMPFPERFLISQMDDEMIQMGQATSLIKIYVFATLAVLSLVLNIIFSSISIYQLFIFYNVDIKLNKEQNKKSIVIWYSIALFLFYLVYLLFGFILIFYLWFIHVKKNTNHLNLNFILNLKDGTYKKSTKIIWIILFCLFPITTFSSIVATTLFSKRDFKSHLIPNANIAKCLTLSNNKPNIIQLYFDRSVGILWNILLIIDDHINPSINSFIRMFPEFNSYINTISLSKLTKISNPIIYGGVLYHPYSKEQNANNWFNNKNNKELNLDDWYFNALKSEIDMMHENGIDCISLNNLPYYRDSKMGSQSFGNMKALQDDFNKISYNNVSTMTNAKLSIHFNNFKINMLQSTGMIDYNAFEQMPMHLKFESNKSNGGGRTLHDIF